jgi:hypothetical protein
MKKSLSVLSLLFGLFVCVTVFSACGGDDEPSSGVNNGSSNNNQTPSNDQTPSTPQSSKHVAKIITEEGNSFYESSFTYDSQGRVIKVTETQSGTGTNSHSETEYQYGEMLIISKMTRERTLTNGQFITDSETHSYTLDNGRIVKDEEKQNGSSSTETFSYDVNNYLSSISSKGSNIESETKIITWSDGNLIKLGNRLFEYSNYPWAKGFPFYLKGSNTDANLFAMGYYGNIPQNLPSKYTYSETSGYTYEYSFDGSYVTKVVITPFVETNKDHKSIMTIIWE